MNTNTNNQETTEDIYERLLDSQINYLIFEDPLEQYTHLTKEEKKKVKAYIMNDTYLWDFAPIAEFISDNIPTTFNDSNFEKLGIKFSTETYKGEHYKLTLDECTKLAGKSVNVIKLDEVYYADKKDIEYKLYQHYLLNFEYEIGNTPVCFDEFKTNELQSEDYLEHINGMKI